MFKRLFSALLGLGAGVTLGIYAIRKVESARVRLSPQHLATSAGTRAGATRGRLAAAVEVGRAAAVAKEAELRAVYRVHEAEGG